MQLRRSRRLFTNEHDTARPPYSRTFSNVVPYAELLAICLFAIASRRPSVADTVHPEESAGPAPSTTYELVSVFSATSVFYRAGSPVGDLRLEFPNGISRPWCTGIVISENQILTAGHCLRDKGKRLPYKALSFTLGNSRKLLDSYALDMATIELGTEPVDYAVIKSTRKFKLQELTLPSIGANPTPKQTLYVYHHPEGFGDDLVLTRLDCQAMENSPVQGFEIHHRCDTDHGSSGAPILDERMSIVGLHLGGGKTEDPSTYNVGVLLSAILANSASVRHAFVTQPSPSSATAVTLAPSLHYSASAGGFSKVNGEWFLTPTGATERSKLVLQTESEDSLILWDSHHDTLYDLPKAGGVGRVRDAKQAAWTGLGLVVPQ